MTTQIVVPSLGESVTEATIAKWFKQVGDSISVDEPLVELETDKVTVEVNAPSGGTLVEIAAAVGATVEVGALLGSIDASGTPAKPAVAAPALAAAVPAAAGAGASAGDYPPAPSAKKLIEENKLDAGAIAGSGKDGRITKGDVIEVLARPAAASAPAKAPSAPRAADPREQRVKMTRLRKRIAERLKEAQNTAAMLTTFNEVDMTALLALRNQYKDAFEKKHGVKLGFMSFFVKACVTALKEWPAVNGEIDGDEVVYKNYYDIGVAVGTPNGLVVPVVRDADKLSFAEVEKAIGGYGKKARDGKLTIEEMTGGT
ncbi:MAG TPA: dihydrolipoyllysine-residue succinyltransferase, partial [Telmatospirillum sp.]|nr:dihydrolipoyllysine-residue succinyltransferase [Telmatospirillum sp.]